ncbi:acyl-CoA dehydrogenase family protein [Streptomyces sp. NPDC088789]|uniref:acyl-CoA dehydrogenase family protein n=1 Tax=Streptomyces sp. NPDC088789 TaxID=3365899 RepID=UPI003822943D
MRLRPDPEQRAFAASLDALLSAADLPGVAREWGRGEHARGRALWSRIADAGVFALAVPEAYEGLGPRPAELALAFVELGRHAVPGPLVETVATAALLAALPDPAPAAHHLPPLARGETLATLTPPDPTPLTPPTPPTPPDPTSLTTARGGGSARLALDGDAAALRLALSPEGLRLSPGHGPVRPSLDPARRLTPLLPGGELLCADPPLGAAVAWARLATAAQALGVGLALLERTVEQVRRRTQFGVPVGSFQAVKHRLADAKIALEFARPLVLGAALTMDPADVAAAKVSACEAAYGTALTALHLHGAIGYTAELDLSLWLTKARALRHAWGTPEQCRAEVLAGHGGRAGR